MQLHQSPPSFFLLEMLLLVKTRWVFFTSTMYHFWALIIHMGLKQDQNYLSRPLASSRVTLLQETMSFEMNGLVMCIFPWTEFSAIYFNPFPITLTSLEVMIRG